MENEKGIPPHDQPQTGITENDDQVQKVQFNELSELNLEARMNVADQIGVPVNNLGDAAALGTMQDRENTPDESVAGTEEEKTDRETTL